MAASSQPCQIESRRSSRSSVRRQRLTDPGGSKISAQRAAALHGFCLSEKVCPGKASPQNGFALTPELPLRIPPAGAAHLAQPRQNGPQLHQPGKIDVVVGVSRPHRVRYRLTARCRSSHSLAAVSRKPARLLDAVVKTVACAPKTSEKMRGFNGIDRTPLPPYHQYNQ